ncbi:unnamed protein product [Calypogeia fissa]
MESSALGVTGRNIAPVAVNGLKIRRNGLVVHLAKCGSLTGRDGWTRGLRSRTSQRSEPLDGVQTSHFSKSYMRTVQVKAADTSNSHDKSKLTLTQLHNAFNTNFSSLEVDQNGGQFHRRNEMIASLSSSLCLSAFMWYSGPAYSSEIRTPNPVYGDVGAVLEVGVQLLYLGALLTLLGVGSFLVVRQVLIKRELENAAKELQDRVRSGEATSLEYFELGAVMLRKKFYQVARKHLNDAIKKWDGSEQDLAQVYNALGYSYFSDGRIELAVTNYQKAVQLQPTYVTAWNNLADAYETQKNYGKALEAYEEAFRFDPSNKVATAKREQMKKRVDRLQGIPKNS